MITCFFENNGKGLLRHVTVNAIVVKDNKVLLGKRGTAIGKPMLESGKWGLLGGFLNRDENLIEAVKREVMEESGWEILISNFFRLKDSPNRPKEDRQNVEIVFIANAIKQTVTSNEEIAELKWFDLDSLPPKKLMAFDHGEDLDLYVKYLKKTFPLPLMG